MVRGNSKVGANVVLNGENLNLAEISAVTYDFAPVSIAANARSKMQSSRSVVQKALADQRPIYGLTTGFGKFKDIYIPPADARTLQRNFLRSHAAGVGRPFDIPTVRAFTLLRANALAKGYSGIRPEVVQLLIDLLNKRVHPVVPEQGSVGASGDLAPLAHLALVLIGEGQAEYEGEILSGGEALARAKLDPVELEAKEGLALVNGTQAMSAIGCLALIDALGLAKIADIAGAMTVDALLGSSKPFSMDVQSVRRHPGHKTSAANLLKLLTDSELMESHADCGMVQDAYSLRCMPQVHGATRQAIEHAQDVLLIEINSATDNPLVFDNEVISAGNFHGQPIAIVLDYLAIAMAELANISERRTERLVNPALSNGLPTFLTEHGGLNSGLMIAQYTAAALVSENKAFAHPASVDSIPTSANQEDHVSMGTIAARKARMIIENVRNVLAIELICAAQALDLRVSIDESKANLKPGNGVRSALECIRKFIPHLKEDRELHLDISAAENLIRSGELLFAVESNVGRLD